MPPMRGGGEKGSLEPEGGAEASSITVLIDMLSSSRSSSKSNNGGNDRVPAG